MSAPSGPSLQYGPFSMRSIYFFPSFEFDFANTQHVLSSFVEQFDDLGVELVDCLAMFGNIHHQIVG